MKKLVVANWKMNFNLDKAQEVFLDILRNSGFVKSEIVICPGLVFLGHLRNYLGTNKQIKLGAQNVFFEEEGAYTGEVSASMLSGFADYVLVGHSERRQYFLEDDEKISKKVGMVLKYKMKAVLCIGETEKERSGERTAEVIKRQLGIALKRVKKTDSSRLVVAYEPVWAISTTQKSVAATEEQIVEAKLIIRKYLVRILGREKGEKVRILYGGSVNLNNVKEYVGRGKMDGVLVGGASLDAVNFLEIIKLIDRLK
jgi:triosephosphate isomerase